MMSKQSDDRLFLVPSLRDRLTEASNRLIQIIDLDQQFGEQEALTGGHKPAEHLLK